MLCSSRFFCSFCLFASAFERDSTCFSICRKVAGDRGSESGGWQEGARLTPGKIPWEFLGGGGGGGGDGDDDGDGGDGGDDGGGELFVGDDNFRFHHGCFDGVTLSILVSL